MTTYEITGVKREGDTNLVAGSNGLTWGYTESYHVIADEFDPLATMGQVLEGSVVLKPEVQALMGYNDGEQISTLPFPSVTIDRDGICVCKSLAGQRDERNPRKWTFTADWSSRLDEGGAGQQNGNPNIDPEQAVPFRETLFEPITRARSRDLIGRAYVNGAGNAYNPQLQVDDELARWDFTQLEPAYAGLVAGYYTTYNSLAISGRSKYAVLTRYDASSTAGTIYPPGIYLANNSGTFVFFAPTDATVLYFNGCVNKSPFLGFPAYSLLLKVRSSKVSTYFGKRRRVTDYTIIYDERNHWDKPANYGPFFLAPQLDAAGNDVGGTQVAYPYIYYTKDIEDDTTDLVVDESGPLGDRNLVLTYDNATNRMKIPTWAITDAQPVGDGTNRMKKVRQEGSNKWVYRAVKGDPTRTYYYIEYVNHNLLDFNDYLRITQ